MRPVRIQRSVPCRRIVVTGQETGDLRSIQARGGQMPGKMENRTGRKTDSTCISRNADAFKTGFHSAVRTLSRQLVSGGSSVEAPARIVIRVILPVSLD